MNRSTSSRVLLQEEPFLPGIAECAWINQGIWPYSWIGLPELKPPFVAAYRIRFSLPEHSVIRVHVTGDERYELYLDGERIGRGPERGDGRNWFFETYDLALRPGKHILAARVWAAGLAAPRSQISLAPGFLLAPDDSKYSELIGTGTASWEAKELKGHAYVRPFSHDFFSIGHGTISCGKEMDWDWCTGTSEGWQPAAVLHPGSSATLRNRVAPAVHLLRPATLPPMREQICTGGQVRYVSFEEGEVLQAHSIPEEVEQWNRLFGHGEALEIPPYTFRRVIVELPGYLCAYPEVRLKGDGGSLQIHWAESLFQEPEARTKGNRSEIEGKYFTGYGDSFEPAGGISREYSTCYWRAGRYLEIRVRTESEPLRIEACRFRATRYPWDPESEFISSDSTLTEIYSLGVAALQASTHDSFIDGPYYEQMMWIGDGIQNSLTSLVLTRDDRLIRKMLRLFDASRVPSLGLTAARWPARDLLIIASYSLVWINILREYAFWRDDPDFVKALLPGMRATLQAFDGFVTPEGLVEPSLGWNFIDWVHGWPDGIPPGKSGAGGMLSWQFVRALTAAAELENAYGEPELAQWAARKSTSLAGKVSGLLWNAQRGLFADTPEGNSYSEHCQADAILSGQLEPKVLDRLRSSLLQTPDITRATISYSHFLFETYRHLGLMEAFLSRLDLWRNLRGLGLCTTPEGPEPTRSDCHAWGAHPIYHFFASLLGIRPSSVGFHTVRCQPQLGSLTWARGSMVHPKGLIELSVKAEGNSYCGRISLPAGVSGELVLPDRTLKVEAGSLQF